MTRVARLILALIVGLAVLTFAASGVVESTVRHWSELDMQERAQLVLRSAQPALAESWNDPGRLTQQLNVLDSDQRDCRTFLGELNALLQDCRRAPNTLFRLAIEEMEAWYLGDRQALLAAYPRAKKEVLNRYQQDGVCGTWELLADAVHPGGTAAIRKAGWPAPGQLKHEWAEKIGPHMRIDDNQSPSFCKLRDGLRRLVAR